LFLCSVPVRGLPWLVPFCCLSNQPFLATDRTSQYQPHFNVSVALAVKRLLFFPPSLDFRCLKHSLSSSSPKSIFLIYSRILVVLSWIVALMLIKPWSSAQVLHLRWNPSCIVRNILVFIYSWSHYISRETTIYLWDPKVFVAALNNCYVSFR